MSKNLTRKGLAFGALVALASSAITGAPASAAGLADNSFVSLVPTTGTEYAVIAGNGTEFKLSANEATTIAAANRNVKFLVTDSAAAIEPKRANSSNYTTGTFDNWSADGTTVTVTEANTFVAGDQIWVDSLTDNIGAVAAAQYTVVTADASSFTFLLARTTTDANSTNTTGTAELVRSKRASDNSYVVDSGVANNTADELLTLVQGNETITRNVTVTAWVDANGNRLIDSTEYASPTRSVSFVKASELAVATTLTPVIGDANLTAKVTTTPVLNGQQQLALTAAFLNVAFTRQDDATTVYSQDDTTGSTTAEWNDTTKTWSVDVSLDADAAAVSSTVNGTTDVADGWATLAAPIGSSTMTSTTATVASKVATVTVNAAHGLRVGDSVDFESAANAAIATGAFKVTAVPSTTTFKFALDVADGALAGTNTDQEYDVATYSNGDSTVDRVFAGTYTAQAYVSAAAAGAKVTASTAAVATSAATLSIAGSATAQTVNAKDNTANLTKIKTGTTSVPVTLTAFDADEAAVSAGRPVIVSTQALVTGSAAAVGSFKINGLSSPQTLYTDASGKVSFTLTETAGLVSAQVRIQAVVEGTVTVGADLDWTDQAYGLVDFNTTGGQYTPASTVTVNRVVLAGGSYTLGLGVTDQWFTAGDAASYRLKVTGSGAPEGLVSLTSGKADVKITDSGITAVGGTFTTTVTLQKATAGVFADTTTVLSVVSTVIAAPSIVTGASGSTLYGNAVVLSSAVTAKALVELDSRSSATATPAYAANAVVNGAVRNASTSVGIEGAIVTVSGASNLLFENGSVAKLGSLSFLSAATTGNFEFKVYSTTAQKDSVVTITVNGVSTTVKVTFTGVSTSVKKLTVTPNAASYIAGQAVTYTIKLTDNLGNPVDTAAVSGTAAAAYITVSYAGPGIISGSLPVETDATGEAVVRIVTGVVDTQSAVLTVKYDQNYDGDFVDTYDLTVASTVAVKAAPEIAATITGATKKIAFTIDNSKGELVQIKVAGKTVKTFTAYSNAHAFGIKAAKGSQAVKVYVAGDLVAAKTVSVK